MTPPQTTRGEGLPSFQRPYADAGHDVQSLFARPWRCASCGAYQIDLSEDLSFGPMRICTPTPDAKERE
jgi:hypothetical protein